MSHQKHLPRASCEGGKPNTRYTPVVLCGRLEQARENAVDHEALEAGVEEADGGNTGRPLADDDEGVPEAHADCRQT